MRRTVLRMALLAAVATLAQAVPAQAATITVSNGDDSGAGSLRAAIAAANEGDTIAIPAITVNLTSEELEIEKNITIVGAGARSTTVSGGHLHRVFEIAVSHSVSISGMTITAGNGLRGAVGGDGGAILDAGTLNLSDVAVTHSSSGSGDGGGVSVEGTATIARSLIADNEATSRGGGMTVFGKLTMTDSTVADNTMTGGNIRGGGVYFNAGTNPSSLVNDTIADNGGVGIGGAALDFESSTAVTGLNTLIAGNFGGVDCEFALATFSQGHNLEDHNDCLLTASGDKVSTNPLLGPLQNNGGPTDTLAISLGSPALDAGQNAGCPEVDQRGTPRPQNGICDIGAYEYVHLADLGIAQSLSTASVAVGAQLTDTITVSNAGPEATNGVVLADSIPAGLTLVSATASQGSCTGAPALSCALGTLAVGASAHVTLVLAATAAGSFANTASVTAALADPQPANNTSTVTIVAAAVIPPGPPAPVLSGLSISPKRWRLGSSLPHISRRTPLGATVSFNLSETAQVTLSFTRLASGTIAHGRCGTPPRHGHRGKRCTRHLVAQSLTFAAHAGVNKVALQGKLSRRVVLAPGQYELSALATAGGRRSAVQIVRFTLLAHKAR